MTAENTRALAIALLSIALPGVPGLRGMAEAQTAVTRLAYDQCWADAASWDSFCYVGAVVDGRDAIVANGLGPKWSPDGSRIAFTGLSNPDVPYYVTYSDPAEILVWNAVDGSITNLTNHPAHDWGPVWSGDGGKIAFVSNRDGPYELYVMEATGANPTRITHDVGFTGTFGWSPDGGRFAFVSDRDGAPELYVTDADGSNLTRLTNDAGFVGPFSWSSDGSRIAFDCLGPGGADICAINADGSHLVRLTSDPARDSGAVFSPVDGRIAFVTERYGTGPEIAVMETDGAVTRLAAGTGGTHPVWSPDGQRLVFVGSIPTFSTGLCYFDSGAHNADDFCGLVYGMDVVNADGSGLTASASGDNPDWFRSRPAQPVAAFTQVCSGATCDFDASGSFDPDGTIASHLWQFGDGTSDSGSAVQHTFATAGSHAVTLTVTDDTGTSGVVQVQVPGPTAPIASFTVTCNGPTCTFDASGSSAPDGTVTSYFWYFGDGGLSTAGPTATHTYPSGTFSPRLTAIDDRGTRGSARETVSVVNAPPVAVFTYTCNGLTCAFDGSGSSDPDGTIQVYQWYFDGGAGYALGMAASRTFTSGTHTVKLVVTSNDYGTATQTRTVTLGAVNTPPVAAFASNCSGLTCAFNASGSSDPDGTIASYAWTFGDGTTGSGATMSRTYLAGGTYSVTLTVTDNAGATSQVSHAVSVNASPVASFTSACSGLACSFDASGSSDPDGTIASYAWTFGDGTTGAGASVSRTYAAGGTYSVTLTVTDNGGAAGTRTQSVTVAAPDMHVGDLDRASTIQQGSWTATATIAIHTASHAVLPNAIVSGTWSGGGTVSCTANANGRCAVSRAGIPKSTGSVTFTVATVAAGSFVYKPASNHDPDGDSNGTAITVIK